MRDRGYMKIKAAAEYIGLSERTVRSLLKTGELTYFRLRSGTILVGFRDVDSWLEKYRVEDGQDRIDKLVEEVTRDFASN